MPPRPPPACWKRSFPFSCGPAALGCVLVTLGWMPSGDGVGDDLEIWRESTAVACPGANPIGLALAAERRGFTSAVRLSGLRPWLRAHIQSGHGFSRLAAYAAIERVLVRECAGAQVPILRSEGPPRELEAGLLLVTATAGRSTERDPHWVGPLPTPDGLEISDPLRSVACRSDRSHREWWEKSGFEETRSRVTVAHRMLPSKPRSPVAVRPH